VRAVPLFTNILSGSRVSALAAKRVTFVVAVI